MGKRAVCSSTITIVPAATSPKRCDRFENTITMIAIIPVGIIYNGASVPVIDSDTPSGSAAKGMLSATRNKFRRIAEEPLIGRPSIPITRIPHAILPKVRPLKYASQNAP